ncbi:unnamed protein product, partial [Nesidiocoris tenuis]
KSLFSKNDPQYCSFVRLTYEPGVLCAKDGERAQRMIHAKQALANHWLPVGLLYV